MKKNYKPIVIRKKKYKDNRGFFQELFLKKEIKLNINFTAIAKSKKNVIRGLHFQSKNKQTKLIYVALGEILDIAVNLKKKSRDFGKVYSFILKEGDMILLPNYFAHGYECLSKKSIVLYHLDKYRDSNNENGLKYNDKFLKIKWKTKNPILSKRDKHHQNFLEFKKKHKGL